MQIYQIKNSVNGKIYIGITTRELWRRLAEHRGDRSRTDTPLHRAMNKYGADKFSITAIGCAETIAELKEKEIEAIRRLRSHVSQGGYNVSLGGDLSFYERTPEIRAKIAKARSGRKASDEAKANMSLAQRAIWTPERQAKLIAPAFTPEAIKKRSASIKGRKLSAETKAKIAESLRGRDLSVAQGILSAARLERVLRTCPSHKKGANLYLAPNGRSHCRACNAKAQAKCKSRRVVA